jgi:L-iditol 2-dehydrogenase
MKAAVLKEARKLVIEEVPDPKAGPNEVVVKVKDVGICGSDLHLYSRGFVPPDTIMGHEVTGTVASVGSGVADWKEGDRVWLSGGAPCGKCEHCLNRNFEMCQNHQSIGLGSLPGGYAEYIKVPTTFMTRLPDGVGSRESALLDTLGCSYHAAVLSAIKPGESALVMGAGPIGLFLVQCLKPLGVQPLILSEPVAKRADLGHELGADFVLNPAKDSTEIECQKLTGGSGPDMVFECVGRPSTVLESVQFVRRQGKVVWVGVCFDEVTFVPALWFFKQISIQMSFGMDRNDVQTCLNLIQDKKVITDRLVSDVISLDELPAAFERLTQPNSEVKILVEF